MQEFYQDAALLQEFLTESEELLQGFDHDLLELESAPDDEELLNRIFRALHTIKGTASFLGFEPIVQLGHRAEDVLSGLRRHELQLTSEVTNALLAARDQLGVMLADLRAGALKQYSIDSLLAELSRLQTANQSLPIAATQPAPPSSASPHLSATPQVSEAPTVASTMRVDVRKLDTLINLIGELVLERNRLLQIAKDLGSGSSAEESPLHSSAVRLSYLTEELQAAGLRTRMIAIETIFCKFPRMVRDLARSLHKEVDLIIRGEQTQIDKTLVEMVSDPLVHLLRNALDHGMEAPEIREQAGKSRRGRICLEALQEGDRIVISVSDDGAGIDTQRVLARALEKGLVSPDRSEGLSQREILNFIFVPGFSTSEQAGELSGRGVGMDVVRANVKKIHGSVELQTRAGAGTSVLLCLPLTVAVLPVLLVQIADETYALHLRSVIETRRASAAHIHQIHGSEVAYFNGEAVPLLRLRGLCATAQAGCRADEKIVVMAMDDRRVALLVDRLVGQESIVIKPLTGCLSDCTGIAGTTIGGDGRVRLVLDPTGLLAGYAAHGQGALQ